MTGNASPHEITPQLLLRAYSIGMFPMAEGADDPSLFWVDPDERGIFPLDGLLVSRSLAKKIRADVFTVRTDCDFQAVIGACAKSAPGRNETWINPRIRNHYVQLFEMGFVHTIEVYDNSENL